MWKNIRILEDKNENVKKYVFEREDAAVESVLYKYPTYQKRTVICCSTQSGCPVGCRFCGTGEYFVRSMTKDEIINQPQLLLEHACKDENINVSQIERLQIMFMSMGEPLLNLKHLIPAMEELHVKYPNAALLISSSGPRVDYEPLVEASVKIPTIGLQFSVHESTDERRNILIPFKNKLTLKEISKVGEYWWAKTNRTPFFNYCVSAENSGQNDADRLFSLFKPEIWQATISVICERDETMKVAHERQRELAEGFRNKLHNLGYRTRVFDPAGQDSIGGGCGQLWWVQKWMKEHKEKILKTVGFGKDIVHTPRLELELV